MKMGVRKLAAALEWHISRGHYWPAKRLLKENIDIAYRSIEHVKNLEYRERLIAIVRKLKEEAKAQNRRRSP